LTPARANHKTTLTAEDAEDAEEKQGRKNKRDMKNLIGGGGSIGALF